MGAVVIYARAKNARGNGGKRAPKTKKGLGTREQREVSPSGVWVGGREKTRPALPSIRAISRVTNLYGIVWFIGRKFNNGRPNNPQEKEGERNHCQEKEGYMRGEEGSREDGKIYDAYVWISASRAKSLSTIFQWDIRCTNRQFMTRIFDNSRRLEKWDWQEKENLFNKCD